MRIRAVVAILVMTTAIAAADKAKDSLACDRGDLKGCERACKAQDGIACTQRGLAAATTGKDAATTKSSFEAACAAGETYGCKLVAQLFEKASPQDLAQAAATYRKACGLGSETACARVGMSREDKVAAASYPPRLVEAIRAACTAKHLPSCTELGALYVTGNGVTADVSTGLTAFDSACAGGELWACSNLGIQFGRDKTTAAMGVEFLDKACTGGIAHACFNLGLQLFESKLIANDKPRALKAFEQTCNLGHALGCTALGRIYLAGDSVTKDAAKAEKLYVKACTAQAANGCLELGRLRDGDHGPADYKVAIDAYTVACDRGSAAGCAGLAIMYHHARGVPENFTKARELYQRACGKKNGAACNNLGVFFVEGKGGAKDPAKAQDFYRQGCDFENGAACINLANATNTRAPLEKGCTDDDGASCRLLGTWLLRGTNGGVDKAKALDMLDKGCKLGETRSCTDAAAARK